MFLFNKRRVVSLILLIPLLFTFFALSPVKAEAFTGGGDVGGIGQEAQEYVDREGVSEGIRTKSKLRESDDERFHYKLEATMHDDEKSFFLNLAGRASDQIYTSYSEFIMFLTNSIFDLNVKIGGIAIWLYESSTNSFFVEDMVDKIGNEIKRLVGVSDGSDPRFERTGFLFSIFKVFALFAVVYAFYKLIWERSFVQSLGELLKFIVVLTVSLLLFTNYGSFLIGMEKVSTEAGGLISGGTKQKENFSEYLWTHFVDEPYFYLQYGTTDVEKIGEERVRDLLVLPVGSGERKKIVDKEVNELNNFYMSYESAPQKFMDSVVLLSFSTVALVPVLIFSVFIEFTQIWFIIIGAIAPFALVIASFPSQFGVLKRYFFELSLPLIVKIALHFLLVMFLFLLRILEQMDMNANEYVLNGQFKESLYATFLVFLMFIGLFLLRKRIMGILSSGNQFVEGVREGLSNMKEGAIKPVKETVKTGAVVGGAVVGGLAGGPYGVAMGAGIGKSVGDIATGGKSPSEAVSEGVGQYTRLKAYKDFEAHREEQRTDREMAQQEREQREREKKQAQLKREQQQAKQAYERSRSPEQRERDRINEEIRLRKADEGFQHTEDIMDAHSVEQPQRLEFYNEVNERDLDMSQINSDVLERHINEGASFDNPKDFVSRLKSEQLTNEINEIAERRQGIAEFKSYLSSKNLTEFEVEDISNRLERKAIDIHKLPQLTLDKVHEEVIQDLASGEAKDYSRAFVDKVNHRLKKQAFEEQRRRLLETER